MRYPNGWPTKIAFDWRNDPKFNAIVARRQMAAMCCAQLGDVNPRIGFDSELLIIGPTDNPLQRTMAWQKKGYPLAFL